MKYRGQFARAIWFAEQVIPLIQTLVDDRTLMEPVPLATDRERSRGFNQSREIARHASELLGVQLGANISRIRETRPQVELNGLERVENVRGAFVAGPGVAGKTVILVDDVVTTGSTMRECASACYEAGALSVTGVAVAAGVN